MFDRCSDTFFYEYWFIYKKESNIRETSWIVGIFFSSLIQNLLKQLKKKNVYAQYDCM